LTFFVICLVLFLGISVFFRVSEIRVEGDTRYTQEEVIRAAGIEFGTHLFFVDYESARQNILSSLPYAEQVRIRRRFPNRVEIDVTDTVALAVIYTEGGYLLLDRRARMLERLEYAPIQRLVDVFGMGDPILPRAGEVLAFGEEGRGRLVYLQDILGTFFTLGLSPRVSELNMSDVYDPRFLYDDRFVVRLGPHQNLHHKLSMLMGIVAYLDEHETGTIDLSGDNPFWSPYIVEDFDGDSADTDADAAGEGEDED